MTGDRRNIRLVIAYDGTDFSGWQRQGSYLKVKNFTTESTECTEFHGEIRYSAESLKFPEFTLKAQDKNIINTPCSSVSSVSSVVNNSSKSQRTVQGVIEAALEKIHKEKITLTGSGRTDAGVHAAGQVANFYTSINSMEAQRFVPALNRLLPHDVRILEAVQTSEHFHSRFDAKYRTYRYCIMPGNSGNAQTAMPWDLRYAWRIWRRPRLDILNSYAGLLRGETDCTVFAVPSDKSLSRRRYIYNSVFWAEGSKIIFEITANAFLWKMVRSVVGTLLFYEEKNLTRAQLHKIIAGGDRSLAGPTAPACGLFLWNIGYY